MHITYPEIYLTEIKKLTNIFLTSTERYFVEELKTCNFVVRNDNYQKFIGVTIKLVLCFV